MEVIVSEIIGVTGVDKNNAYGSASIKRTENSSDFSSFLGETKSMDSIFDEAAGKYNMPVELLKAVGKTESNFNANAVSRCGAQGVMQLMPSTAKELGVTDAFNAEQNIMAGAKYLSGLMRKYDGDPRLALAAYNAGSGNVDKYDGIPPFEETQNYVKKVTKFMGQGDFEIAEANNTVNAKNNAANQFISTANTAPIYRNLSFVLTNETDSTNNEVENLNKLFSYDDYMKFVELFLEDKKDGSEKKSEENSSAYNTNEINYNVPVMNLLKNQNLL